MVVAMRAIGRVSECGMVVVMVVRSPGVRRESGLKSSAAAGRGLNQGTQRGGSPAQCGSSTFQPSTGIVSADRWQARMCKAQLVRRHEVMNRSSFVATPRRVRITAGLALFVLGAAGCVLPISYTERASPEVVGWYRRTDGTPATGARVVVTNDGEDRTCRRPLGVGITDSAGVF